MRSVGRHPHADRGIAVVLVSAASRAAARSWMRLATGFLLVVASSLSDLSCFWCSSRRSGLGATGTAIGRDSAAAGSLATRHASELRRT